MILSFGGKQVSTENKLNQIKIIVSNVKFKNLQFWLEQFKS